MISDQTLKAALETLVKKNKGITRYAKEKRKKKRGRGMSSREIRIYAQRYTEPTARDIAYDIMETAYMQASSGNTLPANARQIMYKARPLILERLEDGKQPWKNDSLFTQKWLPDYMNAHPRKTSGWDVVYDARGHLQEPHTGKVVNLGTLAVRRYTSNWRTEVADLDLSEIDLGINTQGPESRFQFALFMEKEGFHSLLEHQEISKKHDIAIMSAKGISNTSARSLVEQLSDEGVTILVAHDFDKWGLSLCHTLQTSNRRYTFARRPKVKCLGLNLADAQAMNLAAESVSYGRTYVSKGSLIERGATAEEAAFLAGSGRRGQRIELNAMDSQQLIDWLERKFREHGVTKVVPELCSWVKLTKRWRAYRRSGTRMAPLQSKCLLTFPSASVRS